MYVRLRVHAVQWALLLQLDVDKPSPSRLNTDLAGTSFDFVVPGIFSFSGYLIHYTGDNGNAMFP